MATELTADLVCDARADLGEGPVWDVSAQRTWWVDIIGRTVHRFDPATGAEDASIPTPSPVGAVALRAAGGLVAALADGFWTLDLEHLRGSPTAAAWRPLTRFLEPPDLRCNDAKCDPVGRFLAGTMAYDARAGAGGLFSLHPNGRVERVLGGVTISNGLAWSGDGRTLYYVDTPTRRIDAIEYDVVSGRLGGRWPHIVLGDDIPGAPDGLTIDAEGGLWVALWGGWAVHRYAPDGALDAVVHLPVAQVTSCTFGGSDLLDLYITTAAVGLDEAARAVQPGAGGLFRVRSLVSGVAPVAFAG